MQPATAGRLAQAFQKLFPTQPSMITIKDFSAAAFEKKCDLIVRDSDYIMVRNREDANHYLYHVHGFFVEVIYSTSTKRVKMINAFNDLEKIGPYIEEISLAGLTT